MKCFIFTFRSPDFIQGGQFTFYFHCKLHLLLLEYVHIELCSLQ